MRDRIGSKEGAEGIGVDIGLEVMIESADRLPRSRRERLGAAIVEVRW